MQPSIGSFAYQQAVSQVPAPLRYPGRFLTLLSFASIGLLLFLGVLAAQDATSWISWVPLGLAVCMLIAPTVLCWQILKYARARKRYAARQVIVEPDPAQAASAESTTDSATNSATHLAAAAGQRLAAAASEYARRDARHLPRVEAAQRAAKQLAGDQFDAPLLQQDWRVGATAVAATVATIPFALLAALVTGVNLLLR